jgi:uncharacterized membrane protein YbaN (DUF454 family)
MKQAHGSRHMKTQRRRKQDTASVPVDGRGDEIHRTSFDEQYGMMTVLDRRMFRRGQEAFCRRFVTSAARLEGVRSVQVCLGSNTCRLEFAPGKVSSRQMASRFAEAVHAAVPESGAGARPDGRRLDWAILAAFPTAGPLSCWEAVCESTDRLRLRNPILRSDSTLARRVAKELRKVPGIASCRVTPWGRDLKVQFDPAQRADAAVIDAAEACLRQALRPGPARAAAEEEAPQPARGLRRVWYLALAGGSFVMTGVGLIVPGIPTVPFLLATSYYLVRSSPALNRRLLKSRFFGPILDDLQRRGGLRLVSKIKLVGLTMTISGLAILLFLPSLGAVLVVGASSALSLFLVSRIPGIPSETEAESRPKRSRRPALAAGT